MVAGISRTSHLRPSKRFSKNRMLANAGYPVLELSRERYGKILLGDLEEGEHTPVSGEALEWAESVLQLQAPADAPAEAVPINSGRDDQEEAAP